MTEPISMTVPYQPPLASIVVDRWGKAWQREDRGWYRSASDVTQERSWVDVLLGFGPVTVLRSGGGV